MKKIIVIIFLFISYCGFSQDFYYYKDQKVQLQYNTQDIFVMTNLTKPAALQELIGSDLIIKKFLTENGASGLKKRKSATPRYHYWAEVRFANPVSLAQYEKRMETLRQKAAILHVSRYYKNDRSDKIGLSNYINIKLKRESDYNKLVQQCQSLKLILEGQNKFMPLWYNISCTKQSTYDALHAANFLYETGLFTAVEPDLMTDDGPECVNDALFTTQWGHNNTGQLGGTSGIDINVCAAWDITKGSASSIIAVLDHGFEMNHPDLAANTFGTGFDSESGTTPAQVLGDHGTPCAGIIAAVDNNNIGVSGVGPNNRIMSISNSLAGTTNSRTKRADGINWAYQNGADVISNSWGSSTTHAVIDNAIDNALTLGRGGLGYKCCFLSRKR